MRGGQNANFWESVQNLLLGWSIFAPKKELSEEFLEFDYALKYLKGTWNLKKNE